ncbi:hypothetical protein E3N88_28545 [Mikania micrantha]|uniref:Uncharacterized protein n=1 Tax=Mikania micrantha TaxID=192012 RepID=A0A5N6N1C5_9ASTR|nr:hypothetical protein E3N88_28545 [Mikania micrantha]
MTTISGRGHSQKWVTTTNLFYLHSLMTGRPCNLAWCFALYYVSFYHRQERGTLWGGDFVTHIVHTEARLTCFRICRRSSLLNVSGRRGRRHTGAAAATAASGRWFDAGARADSGGAGSITGTRGVAAAASTARLPCSALDLAARGVVAPYCGLVRRDGPGGSSRGRLGDTRRATSRSAR